MISNLIEEKNKRNHRWRWLENMYRSIREQDLVLYIVAFLLGRAVILNELITFSLAYLVSVWLVKKERSRLVVVASLLGAITVGVTNGLILAISFLLFGFFVTLGLFIDSQKHLPYIIFFSSLISRVTITSLIGAWTSYWFLI